MRDKIVPMPAEAASIELPPADTVWHFYAHRGTNSEGRLVWRHLYPSRMATELCSREEVVQVELRFAEDDDPEAYWGWWSVERKGISMVYPHFHLLGMCFTYGIEAEEKRLKGRRVRLRVREVNSVS
jgi:hypothetical protein